MLLRLSEYFDQPEQYIPERWARDGSAHNIHPYLLLPFGFGPRTCAGTAGILFFYSVGYMSCILLCGSFTVVYTYGSMICSVTDISSLS